ncbi:MAG: FtsQ-type POTRA domain-containing protein [Patescibacteria group bacterium]|nr:FtsQ-type POTRA domain-containing protein [Patescibacteria group bacterium]
MIKRKRDYARKKYFNSLFNKKKTFLNKKKRKQKIKIISFLLFFLIIVITIICILFSNYFTIKNVEIKGNKEIEKSQIFSHINDLLNKKVLFLLPNNYWFINEKKLDDNVKNNFNLKKAIIEKKFPDRLLVNIIENKPKFIVINENQDKYYLIDEQGLIIKETNKEKVDSLNNLLKIIDNGLRMDFNDRQVITLDEILFFYKISNYFDKKDQKLDFFEKNEFNKITASLNNNIKIYFNIDENINEQINKLDEIINKEDIKEYIDLMYNNKIYYK